MAELPYWRFTGLEHVIDEAEHQAERREFVHHAFGAWYVRKAFGDKRNFSEVLDDFGLSDPVDQREAALTKALQRRAAVERAEAIKRADQERG